ncbi:MULTISPECIES: type II secretion system minor pseudopilin GspK [unclassified Stenotrophomonas]|uniref:type II secretion system minor pseudopilin GspK n=1 Tax=unclassified Stenotrophomonas TaxID=196198 RepID=UPI001E552673|nr:MULTISPECIES: type II secretion system minor pseudopilin GspK [unclassified Stenotrophomonas]
MSRRSNLSRSNRAMPSRRATQSGMALLAILLLSVVMGVLVVALLDDIRFGVQRTANAQAMAQSQRFALGAETMARKRVGQLARPGVRVDSWSGKPLVFPIENGLIQARLRDGSTCFNLNSVVQGPLGQGQRRELGVRQYVALLDALEFPAAQAQALADALADWVDVDGVRAPLGAEDASYAARRGAYRTAGTLLAEVSELRAVHGYTAQVYRRVRPYVCALPEPALSPVNVNALQVGDAPVLVMLTAGALTVERARQVIATRPAAGWDSTSFFASFPEVSLDTQVYEQITLQPRWFALDVDVDHAGTQATLTALLESRGTGDARLAARRWTRDE